jgi:hypothetical protein
MDRMPDIQETCIRHGRIRRGCIQPRVVNSTTSVQCKVNPRASGPTRYKAVVVQYGPGDLLYGTEGGQFVLQFDLGTAVGLPKKIIDSLGIL